MKKNRFPFLLIGALAAFGSLQTLSAADADYQLNRSSGNPIAIRWYNQTDSYWNQNAPWAGTPGTGGPTGTDHLELASLDGDTFVFDGTVTGFSYSLRSLTVSTLGQGMNPRASGSYTLTINEDLAVHSGASLRLFHDSNDRSLSVTVKGDVQVDQGGLLSLGDHLQTASGNSRASLSGFSVAGSTVVEGRVASHLLNNSGTMNLGDLELKAGGSLVTGATGATTSTASFVRTLTVRSLSGDGAVYASDAAQAGTRNMTLMVATVETSDALFGGVLADSLVASAGTNRLNLAVSGEGSQTLSGIQTYTGSTVVSGNATLAVDGSIQSSSGVRLESGATLGGHGTVSTISGEGTVAVSARSGPGVLTAAGVDGTDGLGFYFRLAAPEREANDLLRLTGETPFTLALGSGNRVTLDFTGVDLVAGDQFFGGFYVDSDGVDLMEAISGAEFQFLGLNEFSITISTLQHEVDFGEGIVAGSITTFTVVPEPGTTVLFALSLLGLAWMGRRRSLPLPRGEG